jgi:type III pantothenate kinase
MGSAMEMWLGLMVGNSRSHWGLFEGETLCRTWDTGHITDDPQESETGFLIATENISTSFFHLPVFLASVVPSQTKIWQTHPNVRIITLDQVPIKSMYPTLGIDRALALYGAGETLGFPMLVIDGGTALTFTGADNNQYLIGGAILPGLGLQFATLGRKTGQLPKVEARSLSSPPPRFALNTEEAIQSGVIYTLVAGLKDFIEAWWQDFPDSKVTITGGDRILLFNYIQCLFPEIAARLMVEKDLIFWGMGEIVISH